MKESAVVCYVYCFLMSTLLLHSIRVWTPLHTVLGCC